MCRLSTDILVARKSITGSSHSGKSTMSLWKDTSLKNNSDVDLDAPSCLVLLVALSFRAGRTDEPTSILPQGFSPLGNVERAEALPYFKMVFYAPA